MAAPRRWVWRKHIWVFFTSTTTQWLQVGLTLALIFFGGWLMQRVVGTALDVSALIIVAAGICAFWTTGHLIGELTARPPAPDDRRPRPRERALFSRFQGGLQRTIVVIAALFTLGLGIGIVLTAILRPTLTWAFVALYYVFLVVWMIVEVIDWYNDQYVLTEDRILDINRIPLIYRQRTEAPLAMVQNATTSQHGIGVLLNIGDVQIETAGYARPILFEDVWRPRLIQELIFNQIDALHLRERERDRETRASQTLRWFEAYHNLTGGVRDIQYDRSVEVGRPGHIRWSVQGPQGAPYRTWVVWDTTSHANEGTYAGAVRAYNVAWYENNEEYDGEGSGVHRVTGLVAPRGVRHIFFRVAVQFTGEQPSYSSPEMRITFVDPLES